jgi:hypothetical protein
MELKEKRQGCSKSKKDPPQKNSTFPYHGREIPLWSGAREGAGGVR